MWTFEYGGIGGIWAGVGEAEALGELVFDNLATLLGITGLMIGFFLNVKIYYAAINISPEYAASIVETYTDYYCAQHARATNFGPRPDVTARAQSNAPSLGRLSGCSLATSRTRGRRAGSQRRRAART